MAWTFTDLKYGWKIAAGITLAATTIYVASNTRERVNQADVIELVLGVTERCLATQYSTNPVAYYVAPPSFVRSWHSNSYETTNVPGDLVTNWYAVLHTNAFTNVIGWRTDRAMMVELDAKIKALVPYYCNTDTVYDGSTNIVMLTVTGLWASLGIGDGTNQFTSVPASGTNAATYGAYPWRIYKTDLEERYKVLNALKTTRYITYGTASNRFDWGGASTWTGAVARVNPLYWFQYSEFDCYTYGQKFSDGDYVYEAFMSEGGMFFPEGLINTNIPHDVFSYVKATIPEVEDVGTNGFVFSDNGLGLMENVWTLRTTTDFNGNNPAWCAEPGPSTSALITNSMGYSFYASGLGCVIEYGNMMFVINWNFQYCTHKYW